jgi:hypothetical protein
MGRYNRLASRFTVPSQGPIELEREPRFDRRSLGPGGLSQPSRRFDFYALFIVRPCTATTTLHNAQALREILTALDALSYS